MGTGSLPWLYIGVWMVEGEREGTGGLVGTMERRERRVEEKDEERVKENEGQQKGRVKVPQPQSFPCR